MENFLAVEYTFSSANPGFINDGAIVDDLLLLVLLLLILLLLYYC